MNLWEAVFCGIIQGLTEFLPVSSSGHLALFHAFFGMETAENHLSFDILLHFATLAVVLIVYRRDVCDVCAGALTVTGKLLRGRLGKEAVSESERMALLLAVATAPMAAGLFLKEPLERLSAYPAVIGVALMLNGSLLLLSDHFSKRNGKALLSVWGAVGVGLFQLLAIVPGISRSGATIAGGMLFGLSRKNAVKFSFLLSVPAILGANVINVPEMLVTPVENKILIFYLMGMAAALIFGFAAMKLLAYISAKEKFGFFAYYCMLVGISALLFSR